MPQIVLFIPEQENKVLKKISKEKGLSKHDTIIHILKEHLQNKENGR